MKKLLILSTMLTSLMACQKKNQLPEYFSFDADGVHYDYTQDLREINTSSGVYKIKALGASVYNNSAVPHVHYIISGKDKNGIPDVPGAVQLEFPGYAVPERDTVLIDGTQATASIWYFHRTNDIYHAKGGSQGSGRIIFTKRSAARLEGTFEFTAIHDANSSTISITNGRFSIIPD